MEPIHTPYNTSKRLANIQVVRFGKILFNLQFIALVTMFASVVVFLIYPLYYFLLVLLALITVFIILLEPWYHALWAGGEVLQQIANFFARSWQYTVPIVAVLALGSIVCLCFDKQQKHPARIIISGIICVLAVGVLLLKIINQGAWV